jgi:hypothetical protein
MEVDAEITPGEPRNEATRSFVITYFTHLQVELPRAAFWRKTYTNETIITLAAIATKLYMVLQSLDDDQRISMILECFDFTGEYVDRETIHMPSHCPLEEHHLKELVYDELVEFHQHACEDKNSKYVDFDQQRECLDCLLRKAADADILSGPAV